MIPLQAMPVLIARLKALDDFCKAATLAATFIDWTEQT
jgi:hypothetical protein